MTNAPTPIYFQDGRLYLARQTCDRYFPEIATVILLRYNDDLLVLPVRQAASGGYLLKRRNAAGDRVVSAADFFRDQGIGDDATWEGRFAWCAQHGGLRVYAFFAM
jgi:hypothetical protein